jgi:hypothetical protein
VWAFVVDRVISVEIGHDIKDVPWTGGTVELPEEPLRIRLFCLAYGWSWDSNSVKVALPPTGSCSIEYSPRPLPLLPGRVDLHVPDPA